LDNIIVILTKAKNSHTQKKNILQKNTKDTPPLSESSENQKNND